MNIEKQKQELKKVQRRKMLKENIQNTKKSTTEWQEKVKTKQAEISSDKQGNDSEASEISKDEPSKLMTKQLSVDEADR